MSTATKPETRTATQRTADAIKQVAQELRLDDAKRLGTALAEVGAEWVSRSPAFAAQVKDMYESMAPKRSAGAGQKPSGSQAGRAAPDVVLVPLKQIDRVLNPAAAPDPYYLLDLYGVNQLALALSRYTVPRLREAVKLVQARHPGTKPAGTTRPHLTAYLVEQVAAGQ